MRQSLSRAALGFFAVVHSDVGFMSLLSTACEPSLEAFGLSLTHSQACAWGFPRHLPGATLVSRLFSMFLPFKSGDFRCDEGSHVGARSRARENRPIFARIFPIFREFLGIFELFSEFSGIFVELFSERIFGNFSPIFGARFFPI
jgi:hypothetical protein